MQVVYFKTNTSRPVGVFCTEDGKIDFSPLGQKFGLDPSSIKFNEVVIPRTGLQSEITWLQIEEYFKQKGKPVGTKEDPVIVIGEAAVHAVSTERGAMNKKRGRDIFNKEFL